MTREECRKEKLRLLAAICRASERGRKRKVRELVRSYLTRDAVKLDAAYHVLGAHGTRQAANELAVSLNLYRPFTDAVEWWRKPKRTQGFRAICALPPRLEAAHLILKDVLQVVLRPAEHAYNIKGKGRDTEAKKIKQSLDQGYTYCYVGDLKDAFPSVRLRALYHLPIPKLVIRNTLDPRNLNFHERRRVHSHTHYYDRDTVKPNGPSGLMQGSPVSNLILNWLMADLTKQLPRGCVAFLYSDNILVASKDESACRRISDSLCSYFAAHRAGPFGLNGEIMSLATGIERMGYRFERCLGGGQTRIAMSRDSYQKLCEELWAAVERDNIAGHGQPIEGFKALQQRMNGFQEITDFSQFVSAMSKQMCNQLESQKAPRPKALKRLPRPKQEQKLKILPKPVKRTSGLGGARIKWFG